MKSLRSLLLFLILSIMVLQTSAISADLGIEPQKIEGKYVGTMEAFTLTYSGRQFKTYDYVVNIFKVVPVGEKLSLKIQCNDCEKRETTLSGCKITAVTPDLMFGCKGETWHVDYQLNGDVLKGNGISSKGSPFSVNVKKVQEIER